MSSSLQMNRKVAVITGANTGIGYSLAEKLVKAYPTIILCLACRSNEKAKEAAKGLSELSSEARIDIVIVDTSNVDSVYTAAATLRERYNHIDYLYLNAGVMTVRGVDWSHFWQGLFSKRIFYMFTTGEGLLIQEDGATKDGLMHVFQTNVFGHYMLIKELESHLGNVSEKSCSPSQLIWTSSSASQRDAFSYEDFQHKNGKDPYGSSKFAIDVVSVGLNNRLNKQGVYSHVVCPGLVMTNMTYGILPQWFWTLVFPIIWLLRFFVPSMTNSASNGAEALYWLSSQDPSSLDPQTKYLSEVNILGQPHVSKKKMNIDPDKAENFLQELDKLDQTLRHR
ncbi:3-keto-steroid reductase/17-beta-hydroxysteroid dehydrogenase 7-like [Physella acuta]|uniref:3-keto-steroid reductase/17-beta-hydroxysteroid dehydrogenase 7-like n=1 Tax=Physella acuta TaxID=109671 RepID=UPI0027DE3D53|nr:3-keto-steroid reductase/17-beta-hydroxysteroid dehydrogenase 7-like [Physella acuta]